MDPSAVSTTWKACSTTGRGAWERRRFSTRWPAVSGRSRAEGLGENGRPVRLGTLLVKRTQCALPWSTRSPCEHAAVGMSATCAAVVVRLCTIPAGRASIGAAPFRESGKDPAPGAFFVEGGASMIVASTIVPASMEPLPFETARKGRLGQLMALQQVAEPEDRRFDRAPRPRHASRKAPHGFNGAASLSRQGGKLRSIRGSVIGCVLRAAFR